MAEADLQPGIVEQVSFRQSAASPGSYTDVANNLFAFPEPTLSPETLPIAAGIDLRVRDRDEFVINIHDISLWDALNTLMVARAKLDLKFTMSGGRTYTFNPCRFTVVPLVSQIPDRQEVFIGATDAAGTPTTDGEDWTSLGTMDGGSQLNASINSRDDGLGLPFYVSGSLEHTFDLFDDAATSVRTTLASYNRALCKLAILNPDGNYLIYSGVTLQLVPHALKFGLDQMVTANVQVSGAAANITSLLTLPASAPDYLYGFQLRTVAASTLQADYLTVVDPA